MTAGAPILGIGDALPDGWHSEMLGTTTVYVRAFGPLKVTVHQTARVGAWTWMAELSAAVVDVGDPAGNAASMLTAANTWIIDRSMAIASALYDARIIP